ncbi:TPA: hypothetical protein DDW35_10590 [Candidatus Sumerlaeota bacterium]|jgi:CRISPR-associated protein Csd2|nr:hypothetical protein [Candidatus Sumerlaeota bacterium]
MATQKLIVFEHASALGNAPAHALFKRLSIKRKDESKPAREFEDYEVILNEAGLPEGITIHKML